MVTIGSKVKQFNSTILMGKNLFIQCNLYFVVLSVTAYRYSSQG